jgi:hypothetical protein
VRSGIGDGRRRLVLEGQAVNAMSEPMNPAPREQIIAH